MALDIDKEEEAIKAGIHRSDLMYTPILPKGDDKNSNNMGIRESKHTSNLIRMDRAKSYRERKLTVDDNYIKLDKQRKGSADNTEHVISRCLLGKSLEDITSPARKTGKSLSFCQFSTTAVVSSSPKASSHATIAVLNEMPPPDTSDAGFPSTLKNKENNNCEVAC